MTKLQMAISKCIFTLETLFDIVSVHQNVYGRVIFQWP